MFFFVFFIFVFIIVFFQAEDGIRDLVRSRGLGDVYKRQVHTLHLEIENLRRTRDLLLPRLLSGQVDLGES